MSRTLNDLTAGVCVYVDETENGTTNHIPYIYLGLDESNNAILLREHSISGYGKFVDAKPANYNGSVIDTYLEGTFLDRFDSETKNAMSITTIKYIGCDSSEQLFMGTISRKCFILSNTEVGGSASSLGNEGISYLSALKTYYNTTNDSTARATTDDNGGDGTYWLRTASNFQYEKDVNNAGNISHLSSIDSWGGGRKRPAISFDKSTPVSDAGAESIFLLPDGRITTWNIVGSMSLGETSSMPKKCKLIVPTEQFQSEQYWVCNNYGDVSPTWVSCNNNGVATFGTSKTADDWELGVKVNLQSGVQGRKIGEPAMIVEFDGGE